MIRKLYQVCSFIVAFGCFALSNEAKAYFENVHDFWLDNGLRVIVIENHKAPIIKQMLFYKTGSIDEKTGKGGLAHLLEHLMFRGTKKISGQQFNDLMERNGAISNAFTSQDVTAYHQLLDISKLDIAMMAEADRMANLQIKDDDFEAERQIVFQERKQRVDNNPSAKFYENLSKVLWQDHPYSKQVTGEDVEIMELSKKDASDFYSTYYVPNNAVLVLSGDIDVGLAKKLAQKYYGALKSHKQADDLKLPLLPKGYRASIEMSLPDVKLGRAVMLYAAPSFNLDKDKVYALEVLAEYMGGDKNSPLYQKLVMLDKKALSADVNYNPISRSYGIFEMGVVPVDNSEKNMAFWIKRAWDYAIQKLDEEQLEMTKSKLLADLTYVEDNPAGIASFVGYMAATKVDLQELDRYESNIKRVSLDDVKAVAEYLQNVSPQAFGVLYPEKEGTNE